jgi:hypothetical protein
MLPTTDINNHSPSPKLNCYALWYVHNGVYYREATLPNRFRCDGTFIRYP